MAIRAFSPIVSIWAHMNSNGIRFPLQRIRSAGGIVEGYGPYGYLEEATVTAIANSGYTFVNWTDSVKRCFHGSGIFV